MQEFKSPTASREVDLGGCALPWLAGHGVGAGGTLEFYSEVVS
jgi:hypothetical protein